MTNPAVIESIKLMTPHGSNLCLPSKQIDNYPAVKKVLLAAGGKYNRNRFIFEGMDAADIQARLTGGEVMNNKQKFQFFETPIDLANRMVQLSNLKMEDRILEPSAGHGNIAGCIGAPDLTMIELDEEKVKNLTEKFDHDCKIVWKDFLEYRDGEFDKIIMNPPFTRGQDIKHIIHAYTMLKDGGRLVAICGGGPRQAEKLKPMSDYWEDLPANTFRSEGTGVNTVLMMIDK
jgi:protein-L-isoaspartate O-methyltransferase